MLRTRPRWGRWSVAILASGWLSVSAALACSLIQSIGDLRYGLLVLSGILLLQLLKLLLQFPSFGDADVGSLRAAAC